MRRVRGCSSIDYVVRISKARSWLSRGALLVDVDTAGELARHHPRVAVNIPLEDLARRAHELGENNKPLVIFAHSWRRGAGPRCGAP